MARDRSLRTTFNEVAETYDSVRPGYPDALFDVLLAGAPRRIVEVGCGTGQATRSLVARGYAPFCIEPGDNLARIFRSKFPDLALEVTEFEDWTPREPCDLLFFPSSWHWIDPAVKHRKAARVIAPGGRLALSWNYPATYRRGFHARVQEAYAAHWPNYRGVPEEPDVRFAAIKDELETNFGPAELHRFPWERHVDAPTYRQLMNTWSDHGRLDPKHKVPLEEHLMRLVGDGATVEYVAVLFVARWDLVRGVR
jgi:SAM-dependent methyltransferase